MTSYALSETAASDIHAALRYITRADSLASALHVHQAFVEAFEVLASSPRVGFRREHLTGLDVRWWPVLGYLIVYRSEASPIEILRVLHGAREMSRVFGE